MSIEDDLEESLKEDNQETIAGENIKDLIDAVDDYISEKHKGELTYLIKQNVTGLEEAIVYQNYFQELFGWRLPSIDKLIAAKIIYTKSIDGKFLNMKVKALEVLQAQINANIQSVPSLSEKLMGIEQKR